MSSRVPARRPPPGLRRRIESLVLRWQARLDAEWADRVAPWAGAGVLFLLYFGVALARSRSLEAGAPLGAYAQAAWLITEGHDAQLTVTGTHLLSMPAPLGFYPLAFLTAVLPTIPTLLGAQAAALALAVVPLWRIARRVARLRVGAAVALAVAYGLHPAVNNLNLADFHPESLAVAPLLAAVYLGLQRRWLPFGAACLLTVVWSAELGIVVAGLGALLALEGQRRPGAWTAAFGLGWTVVGVFVVEARFGEAGLLAPGAFSDHGTGALGVIGGMVTNPFGVLGDLFAEHNLAVVVGLLAPLLFLPLLAPRYLLPAAPLFFLYLVADAPIAGVEGAQLTVPAFTFCFVAATFALTGMGRRSLERVLVDRRVLIAMIAAALAFFMVDAGNSPYRRPWDWGRQDVVDSARRAAADVVGERTAVRVSRSMLPLLAERPRVYELPSSDEPDANSALADGVTAVAVDDRDIPDWSVPEQLGFGDELAEEGFELVYRAHGVSVYSRGGS